MSRLMKRWENILIKEVAILLVPNLFPITENVNKALMSCWLHHPHFKALCQGNIQFYFVCHCSLLCNTVVHSNIFSENHFHSTPVLPWFVRSIIAWQHRVANYSRLIPVCRHSCNKLVSDMMHLIPMQHVVFFNEIFVHGSVSLLVGGSMGKWIFWSPRKWILMTLVIPWLFSLVSPNEKFNWSNNVSSSAVCLTLDYKC